MSERAPAVFLSYASDDVEAARRIAESLRAAGIEVWFDKDELRGGDAWDQKIRRQIRECALFVPMISASTQARLEGYFRREWRQGADRTQDMADGKPFLVPVIIDSTHERDAHVPEVFRTVQWTQLPGGETPPAFVTLIAGLLKPGALESPTVRSARLTLDRAAAAPAKKFRMPVWAIVTIATILGWYALEAWNSRQANEDFAPPPAPPAQPGTANPGAVPPGAAAQTVANASIAVLPFADMSEKRDQEFFSDGLAEELLNVLSKVPDLRVIARTSSFSFKGSSEDIPTIAKNWAWRTYWKAACASRASACASPRSWCARTRARRSGRKPTTAAWTTSSPCRTRSRATWWRS